jgi:photosystem II stability/assembly factor-like uncharacterized protein
MVATHDGGKSWRRVHVPSVSLVDNPYDGGVTRITFANPRDGWLWGSQVWSTRDGGRRWTRAQIAGPVTGLVVSGRWTYVATEDDPTMLLRSKVGGSTWKALGAPHKEDLAQGAQSDGSPLLVAVSNGVIAAFDDVYARRGVNAYARAELWRTSGATRWAELADACHTNTPSGVPAGSPDSLSADPGGNTGTTGSVAAGSQGVDGLSAGPGGDLLAVCPSDSGNVPLLELSTDSGRHFRRVPTSRRLDGAPQAGSEVFSAGRSPIALAMFPESWLQLFHVRHAARIHSLLFRTANGGRTWTTRSYTDEGSGWSPLQFVSPSVGWVIHGAPGAPVDQLLRTTNDGATFHAAALPVVSFRGPREPVTGPLTDAFEPWSVSFVSASRGFVLGTTRCSWSLGSAGGACPAKVLTTSDAGAKWQTLPTSIATLTPDAVASITFADPADGWLDGTRLWATHDGGQRWKPIRLPGVPENAQLSGVVTSGGWAYVALSAINRVTLLRTPVGADDWQPVPGKLPEGKYAASVEALTADGGDVWLGLGLNSGYGLWEVQPRSALIYRGHPCAKAGPQHIGINSMTATSANDVVISCGPGKLDTSTDGGAHLTAVPAPKGGDYFSAMAAPPGRPDTIVMTFPSNYGFAVPPSASPSWIDRTTNDGRTWTRVFYHDDLAGWGDPQFVSPRTGWIIHGYPGTTDQLMRTTNAGATFTAIRF